MSLFHVFIRQADIKDFPILKSLPPQTYLEPYLDPAHPGGTRLEPRQYAPDTLDAFKADLWDYHYDPRSAFPWANYAAADWQYHRPYPKKCHLILEKVIAWSGPYINAGWIPDYGDSLATSDDLSGANSHIFYSGLGPPAFSEVLDIDLSAEFTLAKAWRAANSATIIHEETLTIAAIIRPNFRSNSDPHLIPDSDPDPPVIFYAVASGLPPADLGKAGDYYVDTSAGLPFTNYGPKTTVWPSGTMAEIPQAVYEAAATLKHTRAQLAFAFQAEDELVLLGAVDGSDPPAPSTVFKTGWFVRYDQPAITNYFASGQPLFPPLPIRVGDFRPEIGIVGAGNQPWPRTTWTQTARPTFGLLAIISGDDKFPLGGAGRHYSVPLRDDDDNYIGRGEYWTDDITNPCVFLPPGYNPLDPATGLGGTVSYHYPAWFRVEAGSPVRQIWPFSWTDTFGTSHTGNVYLQATSRFYQTRGTLLLDPQDPPP